MTSSERSDGMQDPTDVFGRTGWDVLYFGRYVLLICVIIATAGAILYLCREMIDGSSVLQFMDVYWPVFFSPIAGWYLGKKAVNDLYKPTGVILHVFYPQHHILRLVFVPDMVFRQMQQSGNSVTYRSPGGQIVYLAKHFDPRDGTVDFGMIHSVPAIEAMTYEDGFVRWQDEAERAMKENILFQTYPEMFAAGLTRSSVKQVLDMFSRAFRHSDTDYGDMDYSNPEDSVREDGDDNAEQ